jgi:hypothetical protein
MSRYAYNLKPCGSSQKDFYGKATVIVTRDKYENTERLISYETQVASHDLRLRRVEIFGWYSNTTSRHIKSFLNTVYGKGSSKVWSVIQCAIKVWKCKSFKAFCDMNPTISTDSTFTIKASGKPTVNLSNVSF